MTYQTNTGMASSVAVTAGEGLVVVWCCGFTVLPPLSFFLYEGPTGGFQRGGSFVNDVLPTYQVPRSLASVAHSRWLMWQAPGDFLSESL